MEDRGHQSGSAFLTILTLAGHRDAAVNHTHTATFIQTPVQVCTCTHTQAPPQSLPHASKAIPSLRQWRWPRCVFGHCHLLPQLSFPLESEHSPGAGYQGFVLFQSLSEAVSHRLTSSVLTSQGCPQTSDPAASLSKVLDHRFVPHTQLYFCFKPPIIVFLRAVTENYHVV